MPKISSALLLSLALILASASPALGQATNDVVDVTTTNDTVDVTTNDDLNEPLGDPYEDDDDSGKWGLLGLLGLAGLLGLRRRDHDRHVDNPSGTVGDRR